MPEDGVDGSLSDQRRKNKQAEKELHQISEKLSHRLEELDQVLRRRGEFAFMLQRRPVSIDALSVFRCLNEFWLKVETRERTTKGRIRVRASPSVTGLPDNTQVGTI